MTVKEKEKREEMGSLYDELKGISDQADEEGWTEDLLEKHENKCDEIEQKKKEIKAIQRQNDLSEELNGDAKDIDTVLNPGDVDDTDIEVKGPAAESEEALYDLTADLFLGIIGNDHEKKARSQQKLYKGGHYEGEQFTRMRNEGFSTLTDEGGAVFLPTRISQMIFDYEKQYGFIPQQAMELPIPQGREKIPNVTGDLEFFAITEGSEIKARKFSFGGILLDPYQWGVIVPWTRKVENEVGQRLVEVVTRKLGEGSAKKKDDTFFKADGTSTYHNIKGLSERADAGDISVKTAPSGENSFGAVSASTYLLMQKELPAGLRTGGVYVFHSDRLFDLMQLEAPDSSYAPERVFRMNAEGDVFLWGKRVYFTEAAFNTDGASEYFGAFVNPNYIAYGNGQNMTSERMTEATITDVDDSTEIKLGASHQAALKVIEEFDLEFGLNDAFALGQTSAS